MSRLTSLNQTLSELQTQRIITVIGHLFFATFLLGCIGYYQERLMAFDAGYYTFHLLNYEEVFVKHNRYISYFTQGFALIAIKMNADIKTAMMIYSGMFGVWYYLIFLVIRYVLKNYQAVLLLIFSLCLTMRYKHFAGHTEITFAIAVAILLFAWMTSGKEEQSWYRPWMYWVGLLLICGWLYIIHPIIVVPLSILFAADILWRNRWVDWRNWASIFIVWMTFLLKFKEVSQDNYESGKVKSLFSSLDIFMNYQDYPIVYSIIEDYFTKEYFLVAPLFLISLMLLLYQKKWLLTLLFIGATIGILALNIVIHAYLGGKVLIMIDGYMGMLGMIFGLAIIYGFQHYFRKPWFYILLAGTIIFSVHQIDTKHLFFKRRLEAFGRTFDKNQPHRQLYIPLQHFDWDSMWYPYQIPVESVMYSSLYDKYNTRTIFLDAANWNGDSTIQQQTKFVNFERLEKPLNPRYFNLPSEPYHMTNKIGWYKKEDK